MGFAALVLALSFRLSLAAAGATPTQTTQGYSASYAGESSSVSAVPGALSQFVVAYVNDGTTVWEPDVVGLIVCDAGGNCGEPAAAPVEDRDWYAPDVYATVDEPVAPGHIGFFEIEVGVPGGTSPGSALAFAGDVGLIASRTVFGNAAFHEEVDVPVPGVAQRLTISGLDTPKTVGDALTMAVDIDDVNVELVGDDDTTVVTATLDPATCAGAPGGPVTLGSPTSMATDGRAWFLFHSLGAYPGCRVGVSAPRLLSNSTTITFAPGAPARLDCGFSPGVVIQEAFASAAVTVRDLYGNSVLPGSSITIAFSKVSGAATSLVTTDDQVTKMGAAFFMVRGLSIGRDTYRANAGGLLLPAECALGVIAG